MTHFLKCVTSQYRLNFLSSAKKLQLTRASSSAPIQGIPNTKIKRVGEDSPQADESATKSRSHFSEVYPQLYTTQEHHLSQLRAHIPVHVSGKTDQVMLPITYLSTALALIFSIYLYKDLF